MRPAAVLNREMMSTLSPQQAREFMACLLLITDRLDELEEEGFQAEKADPGAPPPRGETAPAEIGRHAAGRVDGAQAATSSSGRCSTNRIDFIGPNC
ncbi:MAG: hypothetical protein WDN24_12125 [Sphingomonas sp.]